MKKFFINGASGYLGSHLLSELSKSFDVTSLDHGERPGPAGTLVHCAYFNDLQAEKDFIASLDASVYFVFLSSSAVYGEQDAPVSIDTECRPVSAYGLYKLELETLIRSKFDKYLILRISNPYGKENKVKGVTKIFEEKILSQKDKNIISLDINADHPGQIIRDFIYIDDFVEKTCNLILAEQTGIHNLSSGIGISLESQAEKVFEELKQQDLIGKNTLLNFNYRGYKVGDIKNSVLI